MGRNFKDVRWRKPSKNNVSSQIKKRYAIDAEEAAYFGNSVAIIGDYAIVGAYYEDGRGTNRGAAYILYGF